MFIRKFIISLFVFALIMQADYVSAAMQDYNTKNNDMVKSGTQEIKRVTEEWAREINKFTNPNMDNNMIPTALSKLYDKELSILYADRANKDINNPSSFINQFKENKARIEITEQMPMMIHNGIAINCGLGQIKYMKDDTEHSIPMKFTFVYKEKNKNWLIVHEHLSSAGPNDNFFNQVAPPKPSDNKLKAIPYDEFKEHNQTSPRTLPTPGLENNFDNPPRPPATMEKKIQPTQRDQQGQPY